jgi:uncharacterized protein (TIGR02001 family)
MPRKTMVAISVAAALGLPGIARAADPAPVHSLTGNVGLFSQYIFRGLTQTDRKPAVQGGFDYEHRSGLYAGTWASNVSWLRDGGVYQSGGSGEFDLYGGFRNTVPGTDFSYDVGGLYYWYPGSPVPGAIRANTFELYGSVGWRWVSVKYSRSMDKRTFGVPDSRGTWYLDITASVPLGATGLEAVAHWGKQRYRGQTPGAAFSNHALFSYEDWKLGLTYALPHGFKLGAYYTDTSGANPLAYGSVSEGGPFPRNVARGTGTVFIQKTF